jgi:hypothetical protein
MSEPDRIASIEQQLRDGKERMDAMQAELSDNTTVTREIREMLDMGRAGLRVLGALGAVAKWLGAIAMGIGSIWALVQAVKTGTPPSPK